MRPTTSDADAVANCRVCGQRSDLAPWVRWKAYVWLSCSKCGCGFRVPYESELALHARTQEEAEETQSVYRDYLKFPALFRAAAVEKAQWVSRRLCQGERTAVLEIGAGLGTLGKELVNAGLSPQGYFAVEPNPQFAESIRELGLSCFDGDPRRATYQALEEIKSSFTSIVVIFDHVLEHIPNPILQLKEIAGQWRGKGLFLVEVPNEKGLAWRYRLHDFLRGYPKPPTFPGHINLFTAEGLNKACRDRGFLALKVYQKGIRSTDTLKRVVMAEELSRKAEIAVGILKRIPVDMWLGIAYFLRAEIKFDNSAK